jgi:hypothetical protein
MALEEPAVEHTTGAPAPGEPAPPPLPGEPSMEPVLAPLPPNPKAPAVVARFRPQLSGFGISVVVHLIGLLSLSLFMVAVKQAAPTLGLIVNTSRTTDDALTVVELPKQAHNVTGDVSPEVSEVLEVGPQVETPQLDEKLAGPLTPLGNPMSNTGELSVKNLLQRRAGQGGGLEGRSNNARSSLVGQRGGTPGSEAAVANGLAWLASHQHNNGGWNFDHREGGKCDCPDFGTAGTTTGATALALLPFLGAGYTHQHGEHQEVVKKGLYYLQGRMRKAPQGGDFMEGTMYAQGLTAIALCEAYAMTKDPELRPFAQDAIDYICYAQHTEGGWRYFPGQPGDTTVFGWQFMALKSAYLAKLEVPSPVIERASHYLDTVQTNGGANYGYLRPAQDPTPSAVGLLSRMYIGWPHEKPELAKGVSYLAKLGPSKEDMYFNYYATQVLHHYEGPAWEKWNKELREYLIKTQAKNGHARGSWYFPDKHALSGGRLYTTAMCVMILEVYYRHMPLYGEKSVEEGF